MHPIEEALSKMEPYQRAIAFDRITRVLQGAHREAKIRGHFIYHLDNLVRLLREFGIDLEAL